MFHDLRIGWRSLVRHPLFFLTAAGSLALGIGACTVIFSVVYTLLLRPLPYPNPEQLVHVGMGNPLLGEGAYGGIPPATLEQIRKNPNSGFALIGGFNYDYANLTGVPNPAQLTVGQVTGDFLRVFGVAPHLGRLFTHADCLLASPPTVLLSDEVWRTQFNAAEEIVGKTVTLGDQPRTVIGVMPRGFKDVSNGLDLWLPMAEDGPEMQPTATRRLVTIGRYSAVGARDPQRVRALLATLSANLAQTDPAQFKGWHMELHTLGTATMEAGTRQALWLLLGAVGCVLLVTCANVANLQLVRVAARRREVGVRLALGASGARIMRMALAESLILATVGGGLGVLASGWGVDAVAALLPPGSSPWQDEIRLSLPVLGFAFVISLLTGVLTGLLPAWAAVHQDPSRSMAAGAGGRGASGGPGGARVRAILVITEIALALVLLVGAGLLGRSFLATLRTSAGLRTERTLLLNWSISEARHPAGTPNRTEYLRRVLDSVSAVPGVGGIALSSTEPFNWFIDLHFLLPGQVDGAPETTRQVTAYDAINPEYFSTLGIPLLQGRAFNVRDDAAAPPVIVVNDAFARRFLSPGDPLGRKLTLVFARGAVAFEIVGVSGNVRRNGLDKEPPPQVYVSYLQRPPFYATLCVRAAGSLSAESLTRPVEQAIWQIDPDQPIGKVSTLEHAVSNSIASTKLYVILFGVFAALALALAVLGIYGTIAYSVGQRTREIGIRLALGAQREDVLRLVVGQGARLILLGLGLGLLAAFGLTRLLASLLYGVKATDPGTLVGVVLVLGAAAFLATYLPARRVTRIDPLTALHEE